MIKNNKTYGEVFLDTNPGRGGVLLETFPPEFQAKL